MPRKFIIPEEEFLITNTVQSKGSGEPEQKIAAVEEKNELPTAEESKTSSEPVDLRPMAQNQSQDLMVSEVNDNDYVKVRVGQIQKKETMSAKKMVLMKPSVLARLNRVLKTKLPGKSVD